MRTRSKCETCNSKRRWIKKKLWVVAKATETKISLIKQSSCRRRAVMHSVMEQRMLAGFANKSTEYRIEYRRRIVYRTQNTRRPLHVCIVQWNGDTLNSAQHSGERPKRANKNATSQIKCPMFATANATVAFRVCRDGGLGRWVAAKFMQSVCTMHGAAPPSSSNTIYVLTRPCSGQRNTAWYYHRWLIHRAVVVSRSIACLSFVDVFVVVFFLLRILTLAICINSVWINLTSYMRTPGIMYRRRKSARCISASDRL